MAEIDNLFDEEEVTTVENNAPVIPNKVSAPNADTINEKKLKQEALRNKLKAKQRKNKNMANPKKFTLEPIYHCENIMCLSIMNLEECKQCSVCKTHYYCSADCQKVHWEEHKHLCGKTAGPEAENIKQLLHEASLAAESIYQAAKDGDYMTVMSASGRVPATIFGSILPNINVPYWKTYQQNKIFVTGKTDALGKYFKRKFENILAKHPDQELYIIGILIEPLKENEDSTQGIIRLFLSDGYGNPMDGPDTGKIKIAKQKFTRVVKK